MKINKNLIAEVVNDCCNEIVLYDTTGFGDTGFLREDEDNDFQYKLSEVGIFTVIEHNLMDKINVELADFKVISSEEIINSNYNYSILVPPQKLNIPSDGYYTIKYFAIPLESPKFYTQINYFCDDCGIIHDADNNAEEVEYGCINFEYSNALAFYSEYVFTNNLKAAYVSLMTDKLFDNKKGILSKKNFSECTKIDINESILGSALASIRYLTELCRYDEVQDIIEKLSGCNGVYNNNNCTNCRKSYNHGCGCN